MYVLRYIEFSFKSSFSLFFNDCTILWDYINIWWYKLNFQTFNETDVDDHLIEKSSQKIKIITVGKYITTVQEVYTL